MIVTFKRFCCKECNKVRLHECMNDLAKCLVCDNITDVPEAVIENYID